MKTQSLHAPVANMPGHRDDQSQAKTTAAAAQPKLKPGPGASATTAQWHKAEAQSAATAKQQGFAATPGTWLDKPADPGPESGKMARPAMTMGGKPLPPPPPLEPETAAPTEAPQQRSLWQIVKDTFTDPGGSLGESFDHIYHLARDGRYATPEETSEARRVGSYFNPVLQVAVPGLGIGGGIASTVDMAEKAAQGKKPDPGALLDALPTPGFGMKAGKSVREPEGRFPGSKSMGPPQSRPVVSKGGFRPPVRLSDGRVGYPLSPTKPPRLAQRTEIDKTPARRIGEAQASTSSVADPALPAQAGRQASSPTASSAAPARPGARQLRPQRVTSHGGGRVPCSALAMLRQRSGNRCARTGNSCSRNSRTKHPMSGSAIAMGNLDTWNAGCCPTAIPPIIVSRAWKPSRSTARHPVRSMSRACTTSADNRSRSRTS